jgi:predicted transcriptional regulator
MAMTESKERKVKHQVEAIKKANRKLKDMTSRELTTRMKNMILSVDGSDDQKDINHFVDNELFAVDSKALRAYINQSVPDIDLTFEFVSEETGEEREMQLPMDVGFFWPSE